MAAITAPHRTAAQHQSLLHFIGEGKWSDEKVLAKLREMVLRFPLRTSSRQANTARTRASNSRRLNGFVR
jgi:SRSO17 transposase